MEHTFEDILNSAMLADICEKLFGPNATKAPHFLMHNHCGWACSPFPLNAECKTYAEMVYKHNKIKVTPGELQEWEEFLEKIETLFKKASVNYIELDSIRR